MTPKDQHQLSQQLGHLFSQSLEVSQPVAMLHIIREKLSDGGYQSFYKPEIVDELGRLQHCLHQVHQRMVSIAQLLEKENQQ